MKTILAITGIVLILLTRFYVLGDNPSILNRDEAALAYNALLLETTGKDEWGESWPLTLQSFGDYKLIGYPAFLVIVFKIFGYSDFAVRLPSALAGIGSLYCIYILAIRWLRDKQAIIATTILAGITPIFFFYSHIAFEANLALFFFLSFVVLLLRPFDSKTFLTDILALILLCTAVVTYNTPFILLPFILLIVPFIRGSTQWKKWLFPCLGMLVLFLVFLRFFSSLTAQKQAITIFADPGVQLNYSQYREQFDGVLQTILGNKYFYYSKIIGTNVIASLSPKFLVLRGGSHPWHAVPNWSHLLVTQYILALIGLFFILKQIVVKLSKHKKHELSHFLKNPLLDSETGKHVALVYLLGISLVPSVVTTDAPHATRSLFFIVVLLLVMGFGIQRLREIFNRSRTVLYLVVGSSVLLFALYLHRFSTVYPEQQNDILFSGFEEVIVEVSQNYPTEQVAVVDPGGYQYILVAWYLKIPPSDFFDTVVKQAPNQAGLRYGERLVNYHFIAEPEDRSQAEKISVEWEGGWIVKTH